MNKDEGFMTLTGILIIFFLSILLSVLCSLVYSNRKYIDAYQSELEKKEKCKLILKDIISDLNRLKYEESDYYELDIIKEIFRKYEDKKFVMKDCSSNINVNFFKKDFLENEDVKNYLYLKQSENQIYYGWINKNWSDEETRKKIDKEFDGKNLVIINEMPLINIYMCDLELLDVIANYFKIKNYEKNKYELYELINQKKINKENIKKILSVSDNSMIFEILGTKTSFWNISFSESGKRVNAVIAAIPESKDKIKEYKLIEMLIN